jgi:FkbH-like protein
MWAAGFRRSARYWIRTVTLGGASRVALGCVIGDDAILEPDSALPPFTNVPAGEVWGGNPARCVRKRDGDEVSDARARSVPPRPSALPAEDVRQLVVGALGLPTGTPAEELTARSCASWDSLGQVAIASALFDKYGIAVEPQDLFRIRSLPDIAELIANRRLAPAQSLAPSGAPLPRDREMLPLLDAQEATRALAADSGIETAALQRLMVVVASTFTAEPLASALKLWGKAFGYHLECRFAGYDQIVPTLLDPAGPFAANQNGVNVVLARPEDFAAGSAEGTLLKADQVLDAVERFASLPGRGCQVLVATLPPVVSPFAALDRTQAESLRHHWQTRLDNIAGVRRLEFGELVERLGVHTAGNAASEVLTRAPYSPTLYQELGIALVRQILSGRRSPAKVIALDCDNTLWGEVVGEVGLDGIELGPDGRGRSFQLFQRALLRLKQRGLLLAVVSRNEERDVREVFEKHPGMVLRPEDIAAWRVNWNRKSGNLSEIAAELNLGLDSFVLLDDDPAVRLEVETSLPQVHVVPLPADPAAYCETLARLWLFDGAEATAVDADRTAMARQESRRAGELKAAGSLEDYLASLQLQVDMHPPAEHEWPRLAQLTQRTNQFNLNLRRRTTEEIKSHCLDRPVWTLRAQDRFGDYGLIGVCILQSNGTNGAAEIETLLMSCRALGRGVEDAFLHGIAAAASRRGAARLTADFVAGPRNQLAREFLLRKGFVETGSSRWELSLAQLPELPLHVEFRQSDPKETIAAAGA